MIPNSIAGPEESGISSEHTETFRVGTRNVLWLTVREGRRFILKGLPEALRPHPEEVARLRKEYSLGMRISHPGVAGVYGFENFPETGPVIVMEYVDGITLDQFLTTGKNLDIKLRAGIARQIADALAYMHSLGVSHRDLKPDNIVITRRNEAKIIDIGLGDSEDSVIYKQSLATDQFGAPEQHSPCIGDSRADVYSFGRLLELLLPEKKFRKLRAACLKDDPAGRISMREAEEMLTVATKPRKRGFWWWVLIFYGVMLGLGLIFGIIDEVILKKDGGAGEMPERENTGILPVDNVREPADEQTDAANETAIGIKTDGAKEVGKIEPKITDGKTEPAGDNADFVAIYDKYMAEMNEVLERDYEPGMDLDAAMSLMSSKSIEVANISSRMVDELTMAGCPYGEMSRLSDLLYENMKKTVERIYGLKY
ncbi:MAG: serine/threonine protein kinase [Muribaculaceae bacterium]|nr:serine/threonine protein kinase [Muribaculaceae bacterium]